MAGWYPTMKHAAWSVDELCRHQPCFERGIMTWSIMSSEDVDYVATSGVDVEVNRGENKPGGQTAERLFRKYLCCVSATKKCNELWCRQWKQLVGHVRWMFAASEFIQQISNSQKDKNHLKQAHRCFCELEKTFFTVFHVKHSSCYQTALKQKG